MGSHSSEVKIIFAGLLREKLSRGEKDKLFKPTFPGRVGCRDITSCVEQDFVARLQTNRPSAVSGVAMA